MMQVDIALECARLQHRFALPPLEVQDFSQAAGFADHARSMGQTSYNIQEHNSNSNHQQPDIVQEILSVAEASQNFMNQDHTTTFGGNYTHDHDDFTFFSPNNNQMYDQSFSRSIEIGGLQNEEFIRSDRMVENLRWVGMSDKDLEKVRLFLLFFLAYHILNVTPI